MKLLHFLIAFLLTGICDQASVRKKREPSTVAAVVVGVIGMASTAMQTLAPIPVLPSGPGCQWRGSGIFCNGECLGDEVYVRNWRNYVNSLSEPGYGWGCFTGSKAFCCRLKETDVTWTGVWQSAETGYPYTCKFYEHQQKTSRKQEVPNQCGFLECGLTTQSVRMNEIAEIGGERCNEINLFGLNGTALPGKISWKNLIEGNWEVETWYKK